jgi:hypothetical protein
VYALLASPLLNTESPDSPAAWHEHGVHGRTYGPIPRTLLSAGAAESQGKYWILVRHMFRTREDVTCSPLFPLFTISIMGKVIHSFIHRFGATCPTDGFRRRAVVIIDGLFGRNIVQIADVEA